MSMLWELFCRIVKWLLPSWVKWNPRWGSQISVVITAERQAQSMDIIQITLGIPQGLSTDVVKKVITVDRTPLDGELAAHLEEDLAADQNTFVVEAIQDTEVNVSIVAVDDAGNESEPVTLSFTATDTIPPVLEGGITAEMTGERNVPDAPAGGEAEGGEGEAEGEGEAPAEAEAEAEGEGEGEGEAPAEAEGEGEAEAPAETTEGAGEVPPTQPAAPPAEGSEDASAPLASDGE